ncbi:PepSY domain-containing protein [Halopseudomonas maritima]|uniref:PepSY domain-containing protein n=1 Tax=Halopseudomonas maritima TaxID=2918528 RepID=UPI001EEC5B85|nr:PepSY domain-containing protein [Halopseudomonas maritima]UJJ31199.1 PepSY domain-containing protein [Halopseudomonas maritima]
MAKYWNTAATTDPRPSGRLLLCALVLIPLGVSARDLSQDEALALTEQGHIVPLQVFVNDALQRFPGRLLEAELELDDDRYIYEIEVVTRTRRVMELEYDAVTGDLLDVEEDD